MTALAARQIPPRWAAATVATGLFAVVFGALVAVQPTLAVGLLVFAGAGALAWLAPTANFMLLVFLTAIVPYGLQNQYGVGGGQGTPGLLASDIVLLFGLVRAAVSLLQASLDRRTVFVVFALVAVMAIGGLQALHGLVEGRGLSAVGAEYRVFILLGGSALMALPLLLDPRSRERLLRGLVILGMLLGLWAVIQWTVDLPLSTAQDAGVREGISQTTAGRGQIQGGLFSFPVATVLAAAALISGAVRSPVARGALLAIFVLNLGGLLLTYERTFWVTTALGLVLVAVTASGRARLRALFWGPLALIVFFAVMSTIAPDTLGAARERLLSLGRFESDNSLRYRLTESRHVVEQIQERPLLGSGLAAEIYWGRPWEGVAPTTYHFAHNAYLWVAWKLGLIGAMLLLAAMLLVLIGRAPPTASPLIRSLRTGAKAALLTLLLSSVTFPSFTQLSSVAVYGILIAIAVVPMGPRPGPSATTAQPS